MMYPESEIGHLLDLMPASGRMKTRLVSKPDQRQVIVTVLPRPWDATRLITINFERWGQLTRPQRDLLLLRSTSWITAVRLLKPELYQSMAAAGVVGMLVELFQGDAIGVLTAGGLTAIAGTQIWRNSRGPQAELEADEAAIRVALRRGYTETDAAQHLLFAIEAVATIEDRPNLSFTELLRCQNLRKRAGLSLVDVPETLRKR